MTKGVFFQNHNSCSSSLIHMWGFLLTINIFFTFVYYKLGFMDYIISEDTLRIAALVL